MQQQHQHTPMRALCRNMRKQEDDRISGLRNRRDIARKIEGNKIYYSQDETSKETRFVHWSFICYMLYMPCIYTDRREVLCEDFTRARGSLRGTGVRGIRAERERERQDR